MAALRVKEPEVVHESVDGEVVIVHLDKGTYFSLDKVAAAVWAHIVNGAESHAIANWAGGAYPTVATASSEISNFIGELVEHELVEPDDATTPTVIDAGFEAPAEYDAPTLNAYTDMTDLLLLDPVHDVEEEKGWPNAR